MGHKYFGEILKGKRAVITGGNRGLGILMARRFLECGAKVAIFCAPNEDVTPAVNDLRALDASYEVLGYNPSLTDETALAEIADELNKHWGGLDILVNNAGLTPSWQFEEYPKDKFEQVFDVNVTGMFIVTKTLLPLLKAQPHSAVVNTSSMAGIDGAMRNIAYTSSKFAVEGLTKGMARELGQYGIRVNGVAPACMTKTDVNGNPIPPDSEVLKRQIGGAVTETAMMEAGRIAIKFSPLGRFEAHPDEMINAFIFLASDAASFISGQTIAVSGACIWPAASPLSGLDI